MSEVSSEDDLNEQIDYPEPIFIKDGSPVTFYFKRLTEGQISELTSLIEERGGAICDDEFKANTVIAPLEYIDYYRSKYCFSKTVYAEEIGFVRKCIRAGVYKNTRPQVLNMPGRPPGRERQAFTAQDNDFLTKFLARTCPYVDQGGRMGNRIYKILVSSQDPEWAWAKDRHTWQSWRDHYVKNKETFNQLIEEYVQMDPPAPDGKGQYERKRRPHILVQHGVEQEGEEEEEEEEELSEIEAFRHAPRSHAQDHASVFATDPIPPLSSSDPDHDVNYDWEFEPLPGSSQPMPSASSKPKSRQRPRNVPPMSSQATLVGTQARGTTVPAGEAIYPSTAPNPSRRRMVVEVVVPALSQPTPAAVRTVNESGQPATTQAVTRKRRRINVVDPPESNQARPLTRARSRSVEPRYARRTITMPDKGKARALNADPEFEEPPTVDPAENDFQAPAGQSNEDDDSADVENMLTTNNHTNPIVANSSGRSVAPSIRAEVMSTDDERVQRKITRSSDANRQASASVLRRSLAELPSDDEDDFSASLSIHPLSQSSARALGTSRATRSSAVSHGLFTSDHEPDAATSDTDSIPVAGTKAMTEKRKQIAAQKVQPYTPPPGTRAAETMQNSMRRRLRPRQGQASRIPS